MRSEEDTDIGIRKPMDRRGIGPRARMLPQETGVSIYWFFSHEEFVLVFLLNAWTRGTLLILDELT
jgi:hypothetical protein